MFAALLDKDADTGGVVLDVVSDAMFSITDIIVRLTALLLTSLAELI